MIKILFNGHDLRFLKPIIDYFSNEPKYEVFIDKHAGHNIEDEKKSQELVENCDIVFCEWALGNAVWYSHHKLHNQLLFIRLHHQELRTNYLEEIIWSNVNGIIFICENNKRRFLKKFPYLRNLSTVIYNPIVCSNLDQPKLPLAEFSLGFVGMCPMRKRPDIGLDILQKLKQYDDRFRIVFKGKMPWEYDWLWKKTEERKYYEEFFSKVDHSEYKDSIIFEPYGDNMPEFYSRVGYILSTSDHEGSHQAVAEGMASGAIPVIRNWEGAEFIYPSKYVFDCTENAVELIQSTGSKEVYEMEAAFVKRYAYENFDQAIIIPKYEEVFAQFEKEESSINPSSITKNDLRVLIVCYIRPNSQDGYATRVIEEARSLRKKNIEVVLGVFCHRDHFSNWDLISSHLTFLRNKTESYVHIIPTDDFFEISNILNGSEYIQNKIKELIDLYKVQIVHGESIYPSIYALQAAKESNVKFVFDVHGIAPEESEMNNEHLARIEAIGRAEKEIITFSDLLVFVSNSMQNHFYQKYQLPLDGSIIIPTCVKSSLFNMSFEERVKKRRELGWEEKFIFLYVGTLSVWQWKQAMFSLFEQACKINRKVFFCLLIPESDHSTAKKLFEQKGISPTKYIVEEMNHDEIGSFIGIADAGILLRKEHPVNYVSYPTKFGEYLAAGVPVITTPNVGDVTYLVDSHQLGIVLNPTDEGLNENELLRLVEFMDDVQTNRENWFMYCRSVAKEKLEWERYIDELIDGYMKILKGGEAQLP